MNRTLLGTLIGAFLASSVGAAYADVANGSFSTFTNGLPDGWETYEGAMEPTALSPDGSGLTLSPYGRLGQHITNQPLTSGNYGHYEVSFLAKSTQPAYPAEELLVRLLDTNTSDTLLTRDLVASDLSSTQWRRYYTNLGVPAERAGHNWWLYINNYNGVSGIDNVRVRQTRNLIANGDFADVTGSLPDGWETYENAMEPTTISPDGHALSLSPFGRLGQRINDQPLVLGDTYDISFRAASTQPAFPSTRLLVRLLDTATNEVLAQKDISGELNATEWKPYSASFTVTAPNAGHNWWLYILTEGGVTDIDNVQVTRTRPWKVGEPIVMYFNGFVWADTTTYWTPCDAAHPWPNCTDHTILTPEIAQQAVDGGFNTVWIHDVSELALAEQYGLRAVLTVSGHQSPELFFPSSYDPPGCQSPQTWPCPARLAALNALIDEFKASPSAYAYFIFDEPKPDRFAHLSAIASYLRQRDPDHLTYINLLPPDTAPSELGTTNFATYIEPFMTSVRPGLLSYDSYNLYVRPDGQHIDSSAFFNNMKVMATRAQQAGIPLLPIVQGSAFDTGFTPNAWRLPTAGELRFLSNTALSYGAQGISYFNYWTVDGPDTGGLAPHANGTQTCVFKALKLINPRFKRVATETQKLHWIGTFLRGYRDTDSSGNALPFPSGLSRVPLNAAFNVNVLDSQVYVPDAPLHGALISFFDKAGITSPSAATFTYVVNLDYAVSNTYTISGGGPLSVFNAATGAWTATGQNFAVVTLEPGDGVLVALTSQL